LSAPPDTAAGRYPRPRICRTERRERANIRDKKDKRQRFARTSPTADRRVIREAESGPSDSTCVVFSVDFEARPGVHGLNPLSTAGSTEYRMRGGGGMLKTE
jgi:hypothetical protein